MLKINNHSENYDGTIEIDGVDVAAINGNTNQDGIYINLNSYNVSKMKAGKTDVTKDISEFVGIILNEEDIVIPAINNSDDTVNLDE